MCSKIRTLDYQSFNQKLPSRKLLQIMVLLAISVTAIFYPLQVYQMHCKDKELSHNPTCRLCCPHHTEPPQLKRQARFPALPSATTTQAKSFKVKVVKAHMVILPSRRVVLFPVLLL